jgi:hypothetical protein
MRLWVFGFLGEAFPVTKGWPLLPTGYRCCFIQDLRLRRVALRNRIASSDANPPYDQQYGYLSMDHVKERYRE